MTVKISSSSYFVLMEQRNPTDKNKKQKSSKECNITMLRTSRGTRQEAHASEENKSSYSPHATKLGFKRKYAKTIPWQKEKLTCAMLGSLLCMT